MQCVILRVKFSIYNHQLIKWERNNSYIWYMLFSNTIQRMQNIFIWDFDAALFNRHTGTQTQFMKALNDLRHCILVYVVVCSFCWLFAIMHSVFDFHVRLRLCHLNAHPFSLVWNSIFVRLDWIRFQLWLPQLRKCFAR